MVSSIVQVVSSFILFVIDKIGYTGIFFLMLFESANIPIPSEIIMPFSGFLAQKGGLNFWLVVFVGTFGNLTGSLISYKLADSLMKKEILHRHWFLNLFFNPNDLKLTERWFNKYGGISVFFSRMLPIARTFISFPAGLSKMNIWNFSVLTLVGSLFWSILLTWLGFALGQNWATIQTYFEKFDYLILLAIILGIVFWIKSHFKNKSNINKLLK